MAVGVVTDVDQNAVEIFKFDEKCTVYVWTFYGDYYNNCCGI